MLWDAVSFLLLNQRPIWKLLDHWLSYKTMTMLWCFGNFLCGFELVDLRRLSSFLQAVEIHQMFGFWGGSFGLVQGRASEASASQDFRSDLDAYACFDFRLQSDVWVDLQWVMTRLSKDKNLWWSLFSARPKFEPGEDFVQVVLCSLRLLGSVVGTRFAVCFDRDHAFSLDLCYGRVWT